MPRMPEKKVVLTLRPYTANTKYNWDPVYQKKITVNKNTWRGDPFYELTTRFIYSDWAKTPMDAGPRESIEQIEATGLRYMVTERANNMAVGSWRVPAAADLQAILCVLLQKSSGTGKRRGVAHVRWKY